MTFVSNDNQADIIEAFNSTSRYLNDLLNIDTPYFKGMVNKMYPPKLQLKKANKYFKYRGPIFGFSSIFFIPLFMINAITLTLI